MIQWTYELQFQSAWGIYSGLSVAGLVDRMVVRDADGLPVVPGSSLKGRWRYFAERVLRSHTGSLSSGLSLHDHLKPACKERGQACTLCKWFGSPSIAAGLQVGPAKLHKTDEVNWPEIFKSLNHVPHNVVVRPDTEVRPGVAIDRKYRTAKSDHLFFDEAVAPITFQGVIRLQQAPSKKESEFLKGTAAMVDRLGARKAAGRGRLKGGICISGGAA